MLAKLSAHREEKERGFTIVEVLVTLCIIGILAAIAIPVYTAQRVKAWSTAANSDVANAAIFVSQNPDVIEEGKTYSSITGFNTSKGVTLKVSGDPTCIQAYHENDKSVSHKDTTWHISMQDRKLSKGTC